MLKILENQDFEVPRFLGDQGLGCLDFWADQELGCLISEGVLT